MSAPPPVHPFGAWPSPLSAAALVAGSVRLGGVEVDGACGYWVEGRPAEGGRYVLVERTAAGEVRDLTPAPYNVRTRVHEYGGRCVAVSAGHAWFSNDADRRIHHRTPDGAIAALTADGPWRFADFVLDAARRRLIAVCETHGEGEPVNELVAVSTDDGAVTVLAGGEDFYAAPALSPDGARLAWITWSHPDMPWDACVLRVASVDDDGGLTRIGTWFEGERVSVFQPLWSPGGALYFVADPGGWWNLHRLRDGVVECVEAATEELARPLWQLGMRTLAFDRDGTLVHLRCRDACWRVARLDVEHGTLSDLVTDLDSIDDFALGAGAVVLVAGSPDRAAAVVRVDLASGERAVLRESQRAILAPEDVSIPAAITFPSGGGEHAHAFLYPPRNRRARGPAEERPPLIVIGHGGPTGSTSTSLDLRVQFWTSRGFAVLDVNYRGSTGYGRAYRDSLGGRWGLADVEDCVHGARHVAAQGRADAARLAIRGGSAGGYTALAALAFHDTFGAGASYYGIGDLETLARDTHKFESRYLDSLVGPYPECRERYVSRSPIHHVDGLDCPVIFFQGLEDAVVPPAQAEAMVEALRRKGLPVAYLAFEGEQHGFRRAETIVRTLEAELAFYGRVFGFEPADDLPPLEIENL